MGGRAAARSCSGRFRPAQKQNCRLLLFLRPSVWRGRPSEVRRQQDLINSCQPAPPPPPRTAAPLTSKTPAKTERGRGRGGVRRRGREMTCGRCRRRSRPAAAKRARMRMPFVRLVTNKGRGRPCRCPRATAYARPCSLCAQCARSRPACRSSSPFLRLRRRRSQCSHPRSDVGCPPSSSGSARRKDDDGAGLCPPRSLGLEAGSSNSSMN